MKKIIFIDLDGTLFDDRKQVSPANREALLRAKDAGHEVVFATGRPFDYTELVNKECGNVCRYAITSTGGIIYDFAHKQIIAVTAIPTASTLTLCKDTAADLLIHTTDGLFSNTTTIEEPRRDQVKKPINRPLEQFFTFHTIVQITPASNDYDLIKSMHAGITRIPGIYIINQHKALTDESFQRRGLAFYDIVPTGISKGSGIRTLCNLLRIPREHRVCIGDDLNDLSMFAECGFCVAMGNALPEVKKKANRITLDNNNDGVANYLLALAENNNI